MTTFDIVSGIAIVYVAIGMFVFFLELALDGNMFEIISWDTRDLDKWIGFTCLLLACVGAWPMVVGFEWINKRK